MSDENEFMEITRGEIHGETAYRMLQRKPGEPRRGIFTMQRKGETDAETISRLTAYEEEFLLPVVDENQRLHEI